MNMLAQLNQLNMIFKVAYVLRYHLLSYENL
jgi:hypothetical protein